MDDIRTIIARCKGEQPYNLHELNAVWRARSIEKFRQEPLVYKKLAERCLKLGEPLLACDIIQEGRELKDSLELTRLFVEGLLQCGAYQSASNLAQQLIAHAPQDLQVLSLCGRVFKETGFACGEPAKMRRHLIKAQAFYEETYNFMRRVPSKPGKIHHHKTEYAVAINLATLSVLLGDRRKAYRYVNEVIRELGADGHYAKHQDLPTYVTLGECHIISEDIERAAHFYQKASTLARAELMNIVSMRRQARFLLRCLGRAENELDSIFAVPSVACITGHLVDAPKSEFARLPADALPKLKSAISHLITKYQIEIGYCSGGSGGDLLFAEELLGRHGEVNLILPFGPNQFRCTLETLSGPGEWLKTFDHVLANATSVTILSDEIGTDDQAPYQYCSETVEGLAALRARTLATEPINIAVWDELECDDLRTTSQTVKRWQLRGSTPQIISTRAFFTNKIEAGEIPTRADLFAADEKQEIVAILFADTAGFSRITDRDIPRYVDLFIGSIARLVQVMGLKGIYKNSWGDAIFMVFNELDQAAEFSLKLCENLHEINWRQKGLPQNLSLRMALHAGPVYRLWDPVTEQPNYYGYHISKGARLEPITPPGQVYTSESFAALMTARGIKGYACDYVGRIIHPKKFGTHPIYHLKRHNQ